MAERLSDDEIEARMPAGWSRDGDEIVCTYEFDDYLAGVAYASEVAEVAEEQFHHPEIVIGYEEVEIRLTSHDVGGITERDLDMAERCNDLR